MSFTRPRILSIVLLATVVTIVCAQITAGQDSAAASSLLISVTWKTNNPSGNSPLISGVESAAVAANPGFGAANVWNNLQNPWAPPLTKNPSWKNLQDSTGKTTNVTLSLTGTIQPVDLWPWIPNPDPLRSAFIAWNSWTQGGGGGGAGETASLAWKLTGLPPNATFDLCIYGTVADAERGFNMTVQGKTEIVHVPTFNSANAPPPYCVMFSSVVSDASGTLTGKGAGIGNNLTASNEADWSGFQLLQVNPNRPGPSKTGFWRGAN